MKKKLIETYRKYEIALRRIAEQEPYYIEYMIDGGPDYDGRDCEKCEEIINIAKEALK